MASSDAWLASITRDRAATAWLPSPSATDQLRPTLHQEVEQRLGGVDQPHELLVLRGQVRRHLVGVVEEGGQLPSRSAMAEDTSRSR